MTLRDKEELEVCFLFIYFLVLFAFVVLFLLKKTIILHTFEFLSQNLTCAAENLFLSICCQGNALQ